MVGKIAMTRRSRYREIGERAVHRLAEHLRKSGHLVKIMNGAYGQPDLIFDKYAVEVKHVQFLYKSKKNDTYYASYGDLKCDKESWKRMCKWSKENGYEPVMIAVTEISRKRREFLLFTEPHVNLLMLRNEPAKWMHVPSWEMLMIGVRI